jgi:hypothetical protein
MASPDYIREKLCAAMSSLATTAAPLQRRLELAHDQLHRLRPDDFTDLEERELFGRIVMVLTSVEPHGDEGSVAATTRAMSDTDAEQVARWIDDLHGRWFPLWLVDPERER